VTSEQTNRIADWGIQNEYGPLKDVLLCKPTYYDWLPASSISKDTLRRGLKLDRGLAAKQHREMVQAYEDAGVTCHFLDEDLNQQLRARGFEVYDPDVSQFTLGGGGVHCMCQPLKRD
jgi:N-dimethylarginine dimethylaminohydrolase